MIERRWVEPAPKWALRDLRREEARPGDLLDGIRTAWHVQTYLGQPWS